MSADSVERIKQGLGKLASNYNDLAGVIYDELPVLSGKLVEYFSLNTLPESECNSRLVDMVVGSSPNFHGGRPYYELAADPAVGEEAVFDHIANVAHLGFH